MSLATGVKLECLDDAVLAVPEVRRTIQRGELAAERVTPTPQQPELVAVSAVTDSASISQPKKKRGNR